jgi:hypothetical protein
MTIVAKCMEQKPIVGGLTSASAEAQDRNTIVPDWCMCGALGCSNNLESESTFRPTFIYRLEVLPGRCTVADRSVCMTGNACASSATATRSFTGTTVR